MVRAKFFLLPFEAARLTALIKLWKRMHMLWESVIASSNYERFSLCREDAGKISGILEMYKGKG